MGFRMFGQWGWLSIRRTKRMISKSHWWLEIVMRLSVSRRKTENKQIEFRWWNEKPEKFNNNNVLYAGCRSSNVNHWTVTLIVSSPTDVDEFMHSLLFRIWLAPFSHLHQRSILRNEHQASERHPQSTKWNIKSNNKTKRGKIQSGEYHWLSISHTLHTKHTINITICKQKVGFITNRHKLFIKKHKTYKGGGNVVVVPRCRFRASARCPAIFHPDWTLLLDWCFVVVSSSIFISFRNILRCGTSPNGVHDVVVRCYCWMLLCRLSMLWTCCELLLFYLLCIQVK